jgi:hypothetical protein
MDKNNPCDEVRRSCNFILSKINKKAIPSVVIKDEEIRKFTEKLEEKLN